MILSAVGNSHCPRDSRTPGSTGADPTGYQRNCKRVARGATCPEKPSRGSRQGPTRGFRGNPALTDRAQNVLDLFDSVRFAVELQKNHSQAVMPLEIAESADQFLIVRIGSFLDAEFGGLTADVDV